MSCLWIDRGEDGIYACALIHFSFGLAPDQYCPFVLLPLAAWIVGCWQNPDPTSGYWRIFDSERFADRHAAFPVEIRQSAVSDQNACFVCC